jgi:hypothetical protein
MRLRPAPIAPETVAFIDATVREMMAPYALREVKIRAAYNHADEPAIFIDIEHDLSPTPIDQNVLYALDRRIHDHVWDSGDDRFPYVFHHFHEDQKGTWDA